MQAETAQGKKQLLFYHVREDVVLPRPIGGQF